MSRKRISVPELTWIVTQELQEASDCPKGIILGVVPDAGGWRVVVGSRSRKYFNNALHRRLSAIEKRLQTSYLLEE